MPARSERSSGDAGFPVRHVTDIPPKPKDARWLIEPLFAAAGVGIVGGMPKCLKTWLAAELALAVAAGGQAMGRFPARQQGPVLVFAAEDGAQDMRARFEAVALARGVHLAKAPVLWLDLIELHLDDARQLQRLRATVARLKPRLLVLDPFVRIVGRIDENSAQEVSAVLGALRALQREHDVAVLVVHHMRKSPAPHLGQALRGTGDFAAWSDSGLYLVRRGADLILAVEHRAAPAPSPLRLHLASEPAPHLIAQDLDARPASAVVAEAADSFEGELLDCLRRGRRPQTTVELRAALSVRKAKLLDALRHLKQRGLVARDEAGWSFVSARSQP